MRTTLALIVSLGAIAGCSTHWPMYRHNSLRSGGQINGSDLSNPARVAGLAVRWTFTVSAADTVSGMTRAFRASPIVQANRVFIGSGNGRLYALDGNTGAVLWKYPNPPAPPLRS